MSLNRPKKKIAFRKVANFEDNEYRTISEIGAVNDQGGLYRTEKKPKKKLIKEKYSTINVDTDESPKIKTVINMIKNLIVILIKMI